MSRRKPDDSTTVFSTEHGRHCRKCGKPLARCVCKNAAKGDPGDGILRIRRETSGRKGKTVTTIRGFGDLDAPGLKQLAKELKQKCGSGGSVKDGVIEIQGDHRDTVQALLEAKGYRVKLAGG